ncbi:MAG TPA: class I SAM-dependent methyltransferase [Gaiellaceae bacterium]
MLRTSVADPSRSCDRTAILRASSRVTSTPVTPPIDFVLSQLPPPPRRVLEVGCGEGELARALAAAGHDVVAIDPEAPRGRIFRRTTLEAFAEPEPFDAVVASRSLHHVHDLGGALDKLLRLLAGPLILNEFAWDRRKPMTREWAEEHEGLHGYGVMRAELDARFEERFFEWRPYLVDGEEVPGLGFRYVGVARKPS